MSHPRVLRTQQGQQIALGRQLGSGGEGIVYEVQGAPSIAAKIYHPDKAAERHQKIRAMVSAGWHKNQSTAAFPIDALFAGSNAFVGFTMPLVSGQREIHDLYSPTSRRTAFPSASFRFLIRTSLNIARAVAGIHATGCVIGDLNQSGILIAPNAIATLIDCDSFQTTANGQTFLCTVGKEEFTPPELQGKRFDQVIRTPDHDAFALAVVIFYVLFMGRHPFVGRPLGRGDVPPIQTAIAEYRFAYSARTHETRLEPPPHVPLLTDLPKELSDAFESAFGRIGASRARPTAAAWVSMLDRAEREIVPCSNSPAHHFFRTAASCPWCRMEAAYPGFLAFAPQIISPSFNPINLGQLIAAVRGLPDPGVAAELSTLMPAFAGTPTPVTANLKQLVTAYAAGLAGAFITVLLFRMQVIPAVGALLALGGAIFLAIRQPQALELLEKTSTQATAAWKNIEGKWQQAKDNLTFLNKRREADELIRKLQSLPNEESKQLSELKKRQHEAQLTLFLERFYLDDPRTRIKGVGNSRKITLRSYGIETAADVNQTQIQRIDGFGPVITGAIVAWRRSLERQFVYNPNQPINPADIAAIRAKIAHEHRQLEQRLRAGLAELQNCANQIAALRTHLRNAAMSLWNTKRQADLNATTYLKVLSKRNRLIAVAAVSLAALFIPVPANPTKPPSITQAPPSPQTKDPPRIPNTPTPPTRPQQQPQSGGNTAKLEPKSPAPSAPSKFEPLPKSAAPPTPSNSPASPLSNNSAPEVKPGPVPPLAERTTTPPTEPLPSTAPSMSSPDVVLPPEPPPRPALEPLTASVVLALQTRLRALGYSSPLTGGLDTQTREALRDFNVANQIDSSEVWNLNTQQRLKSDTATPASQSFLGNWSTSECRVAPGQEPPLSINSRRAKSNAGALCEFKKVNYSGSGWKLQALCQFENKRWNANITLNLNGNQLTWTSERGVSHYVRCN